jgi:NDP-sugar pyrophosphorylase family protein
MNYANERELLQYLYPKSEIPKYKREVKEIIDLKDEIEKTQVIILAGGTGKRMGNPNLPKALQVVAGKTLIDRCIEFYARCGLKNFILLTGFLHEEIEKHVGDGSKYGVNVKYCVDPPIKKVGKGKALKNAIQQGAIDLGKKAIVAYPDDVFLDESLPLKLVKSHCGLTKKGVAATIVCAKGIEYPYGVALAYDDGEIIDEFLEKPIAAIPSAVGLCIIEPEVYKVIEEKVDMNEEEAVELESVVFPYLAKIKKLGRLEIEVGEWIAINTQKELEIAEKLLQKKK